MVEMIKYGILHELSATNLKLRNRNT